MLKTDSLSVRACLAAGLFALGLAGCGGGPDPAASGAPKTPATILADGSSTVFPITSEAARRFLRQQRDADIRVSYSGTTAGLRLFCAGSIDIGNASRMMNDEERAACAVNGVEFLQLPLALDTVAVVVHFDNHWVDNLTLGELRKIWEPAAEGTLMRWNQVRREWPDQPLVLFGRGQDSGTYDVFTSRVTGAARSSRRDYTASEDEEFLAEALAGEPNSLGFFGIGAYHRHWEALRVVPIDAGNGPVYPSLETAQNGRYQPLTRQMYLYVSKAALTQKPHLAPFLDHYFAGINRWLPLTGYLLLHEDIYATNRFSIKQLLGAATAPVRDQRTGDPR